MNDSECLVCSCWCPDRTLAQARKYIAESMGKRYAEGVILDLEKTWEESDPRTPLICFLSMGSDPTNNIEGLAKKLRLDCQAISMGQGQEVHARRLLQQSMSSVRSHSRHGQHGSHACLILSVQFASFRVAGCCCRIATWGLTSWRSYWRLCRKLSPSMTPAEYGLQLKSTQSSPFLCCKYALTLSKCVCNHVVCVSSCIVQHQVHQ